MGKVIKMHGQLPSEQPLTVREQTETIEIGTLISTSACMSTDTKMSRRITQETPCPYRTCYQRDRDRIIHSHAFQRLKHKTQVFLSPVSDHYKTRMTHTLEVSQIARTIARALRLNEDLTEAIALGHDLGHSPFGHSGEAILDEICLHGFKHYLQSVRVVHYIEKDGEGLNLTLAVLNGIACHTNAKAITKEGQVVRLADKVAYINHDIEDAVRAGILQPSDLPKESVQVLGKNKGERITTLIASIVKNGAENIGFDSESVRDAHDYLRSFLFDYVYLNPVAKSEEKKAKGLIEKLYDYFMKNPDRLPVVYKQIANKFDKDRAVCDYIAGMSDSYAVEKFSEIFVPKSWR